MPLPIPIISGHTVEYRTPTPHGTITVRVIFALATPRVICFLFHDDLRNPEPISMFWDELKDYVEDASNRIRFNS